MAFVTTSQVDDALLELLTDSGIGTMISADLR